jgi:hypothetical protein
VANGVEGAKATPFGPIGVQPSQTSATSLTGTVTFPAGSSGSLYLFAFDPNSHQGGLHHVSSPTSPYNYTLNVPQNGKYVVIALIDLGDDGYLGPTDPMSPFDFSALVAVNGANTPVPTLALNSTAVHVQTSTSHDKYANSSTDSYTVGLATLSQAKLPVAVTLVSGAQLSVPWDIGVDSSNDGVGGQVMYLPRQAVNSVAPAVGDAYVLDVTYSDGTTERIASSIKLAPLAIPATIAPKGAGASTMPTFSWTAPSPLPPGVFSYEIDVQPQNGGNNVFQANSIDSAATTLNWSGSALSGATNYRWRLYAHDTAGNESMIETDFVTQ